MIAVAVVGALLSTARLVYFWQRYQALAAMHASKEMAYVQQAQRCEKRRDWAAFQTVVCDSRFDSVCSSWGQIANASSSAALHLRRLAAHESRLRLKYERAARRPWHPVCPDPPPPK